MWPLLRDRIFPSRGKSRNIVEILAYWGGWRHRCTGGARRGSIRPLQCLNTLVMGGNGLSRPGGNLGFEDPPKGSYSVASWVCYGSSVRDYNVLPKKKYIGGSKLSLRTKPTVRIKLIKWSLIAIRDEGLGFESNQFLADLEIQLKPTSQASSLALTNGRSPINQKF